jgi:hypothetical protein
MIRKYGERRCQTQHASQRGSDRHDSPLATGVTVPRGQDGEAEEQDGEADNQQNLHE